MGHVFLSEKYEELDRNVRPRLSDRIERFLSRWEWRGFDKRCVCCKALPFHYHTNICKQGNLLAEFIGNMILEEERLAQEKAA
jgi:hypothetical protein